MKILETACRIMVGIAFSLMIFAVLLQVYARNCSSIPFFTEMLPAACISSPIWTEELTRFALLFLAAFGAGLSLRSGDLVNVDVVCESLPGKLPWILRLVSAVLGVAVCAFVLLPAWKYVEIGGFQSSPALGVRMNFIHLSIFLLLAILGVFFLLRVINMLKGADNGLPLREEE